MKLQSFLALGVAFMIGCSGDDPVEVESLTDSDVSESEPIDTGSQTFDTAPPPDAQEETAPPDDADVDADMPDADMPDAEDAADAAPAPRIACGNTTCDSATQVCCVAAAGGAQTCIAKGTACSGGQLTCSSPSSCSAGEKCCLSTLAGLVSGSTCKVECAAGEQTMCATRADCGGTRCARSGGLLVCQ
jgi:hypothetical protein